jgi:hypothetical protein
MWKTFSNGQIFSVIHSYPFFHSSAFAHSFRAGGKFEYLIRWPRCFASECMHNFVTNYVAFKAFLVYFMARNLSKLVFNCYIFDKCYQEAKWSFGNDDLKRLYIEQARVKSSNACVHSCIQPQVLLILLPRLFHDNLHKFYNISIRLML